MKKLQNNLAVKAVAVLLFLACITGAAFGLERDAEPRALLGASGFRSGAS